MKNSTEHIRIEENRTLTEEKKKEKDRERKKQLQNKSEEKGRNNIKKIQTSKDFRNWPSYREYKMNNIDVYIF